MNDNYPTIKLTSVTRNYKQGGNILKILKGIDLQIFPGEVVALLGPSGSGKSTLLHIAGLLEDHDNGEVYISGENCSIMDDDERTRIRREKIGFIYQYHYLLPEFSAMENIMIPQIIAGKTKKEATSRADELLGWMNLKNRSNHRPARLSGGEQQRIAIARAVAVRPELLIGDEPTGNLDPQTASVVFEILINLARGAGLAALIATHNNELASKMDRIVSLKDGALF